MSTITPSSTGQLWTTNTCFADVDAYTSHLCRNLVCRDVVEQLDIGIASPDQVQRQQQRDEPVRENTHLVLDILASRLRSYHSIVGFFYFGS